MFPLQPLLLWKNVLAKFKKHLINDPDIIINTFPIDEKSADVAQLVEHRFCKPTVVGSNPIISSIINNLEPWRGSRVAKGSRL
jgi:hypothetical protein